MIPAGVVRIIWAIAPSPALRDAMLGDFDEEYNARLRRAGRAAARRWCWREALYSLGGALYRSRPDFRALFTAIIPAVLWGYLVAACASLAATMLLLPPVYRYVPVSHAAALMLGIGPVALCTAIIAGYEAARVGRGAPLWSALALGVVIAAVSVPVTSFVWFWPVMMPLAPACCLAGAILQQAQSHRLVWETATHA